MELTIDNNKVFAATGGQPFDASKPTVVFMHGSGLDHRSWALQTRWFAFHGYSVLAPDLPGHSLSTGEALESIEEMGAWLVKTIDAAKIENLHLVGHSQGFLIALEAATLLGERVRSITAIGTAAAIPVNPALIESAQQSSAKAAGMMLLWGFGQNAHMGISAVPGMQPIGIGKEIMSANPLAADLIACNNYKQGSSVAKSLSCPALVVLAKQDKMTPAKQGLKLAADLGVEAVVIKNSGHMIPIEAPDQCLTVIKEFIQSIENQS